MTEGSLSLHSFLHKAGDVKMAPLWDDSSITLVPAEGLIPGFAAVVSKDGSGSNGGCSKITMVFFLHVNAFSRLYFHSQGVWACESLEVWSMEGGKKTELSLNPGRCDTSLTSEQNSERERDRVPGPSCSVCQLHTPIDPCQPKATHLSFVVHSRD